MHPVLKRSLFLVKEKVGMFKAANNFNIHDPATDAILMHCREEKLGRFTKMFRFSSYKRMTPFHVEIRTVIGENVLTVKRGFSLFLSNVEVLDENNNMVGRFKQKLFSVGGKFDVMDAENQVVCTLNGNWASWDFKFSRDSEELAYISKKWTGLGKELFTTADNYMLVINENVSEEDSRRILILAAVLCIDMVLKE